MLRIAIGKNGTLSSVSEDGKLIPANHVDIHLAVGQDTLITIKGFEADGPGKAKAFERVVTMMNEEVQLETV